MFKTTKLLVNLLINFYFYHHKKIYLYQVLHMYLDHLLMHLTKIILKLVDKKGIINVGGKKSSAYNFAKMYNKKIIIKNIIH